MKVSQIIKLTSQLVGENLPDRYLYDSGSEALQDERVQKLLTAANFVLSELYCEYATDVQTVAVTCQNNFIDTSSLRLNRVLSLTDAAGSSVKYRYTAGGLFASDGSYRLTYARLPDPLLWDDEVVLPSPRITERTFAFGVAAEYMLLCGDSNGADLWETRYQQALRTAAVKTSSQNMPVGRWI